MWRHWIDYWGWQRSATTCAEVVCALPNGSPQRLPSKNYAYELEDALKTLSTFDEGPDLVLYYKYLLFLKGDADYQHHLNAFDKLGPSQKDFAVSQLALFERWWDRWPGKQYPVE